ncbi:hypothetical protein [Streptomyces drozdowiczii]|uniref:hypothetical protein n=1 Tax=Streptomyces drozdowiczii TaxID=202862 RepID=UPI00224623F4|nr:hypothetical protein [Streptomyces drozdowiczii]MCX0246683.1 hypothetical protein [Streptomyces drozdowiczii]
MDTDGSSIPDEEWERFLREAEAGTPGAPEEPSARARMVTQRLREETGPPPGWRTHQPPRRRGRVGYVVGLVVVVALLVVALVPGRAAGWLGFHGGGGATAATPGAATPDDPFKGSPAEHWAAGTAGIRMPSARATGWMSEKQVSDALDSSLAFLSDAGLDPAVLRGERPAKAIAALNTKQPGISDYLANAFDSPTREDDPLLLFSRFDPSYARLAGDVVKTRGELRYREGERGAVEITADVTFVYAVGRASGDSDAVARTIARREIVMSWDDPDKVITAPGTFSLTSYRLDAANGGCENTTGYFRPDFEKEPGPSDGAAEVDPYERDTSMDERVNGRDASDCDTATRT